MTTPQSPNLVEARVLVDEMKAERLDFLTTGLYTYPNVAVDQQFVEALLEFAPKAETTITALAAEVERLRGEVDELHAQIAATGIDP